MSTTYHVRFLVDEGFYIVIGDGFYEGIELLFWRYAITSIIPKRALEICAPFIIFTTFVVPPVKSG